MDIKPCILQTSLAKFMMLIAMIVDVLRQSWPIFSASTLCWELRIKLRTLWKTGPDLGKDRSYSFLLSSLSRMFPESSSPSSHYSNIFSSPIQKIYWVSLLCSTEYTLDAHRRKSHPSHDLYSASFSLFSTFFIFSTRSYFACADHWLKGPKVILHVKSWRHCCLFEDSKPPLSY